MQRLRLYLSYERNDYVNEHEINVVLSARRYRRIKFTPPFFARRIKKFNVQIVQNRWENIKC